MARHLRLLGSLLILGAALIFTARGQWPWRRLDTPPVALMAEAFTERVDTLRSGETLSDLFARHGVDELSEPGQVSRLGLDPRRIPAGLVFSFRKTAADTAPSRVLVRIGPEQRIELKREVTGWESERQQVRWTPEVERIDGPIDNSLYEALDAGVPDQLLDGSERSRLAWDLADVFAWQVDFSRDIRPGDHFTVAFERLVSEEGDVRMGRILAATLLIDGRTITGYRFDGPNGRVGWYDGEGNSLHRAFLRAPVQFRRISSSFSRSRFHPILGYARRHEGTDYAAAPGTPVMAAGDGRVTQAGWEGGYGNLIEIRHRNGITTRYGHLRGFASGIHAGAEVSQGEVIGYVGQTGLASGPHLHYEFRVNGVARDSRSVTLGAGEPLPAASRASFDAERGRLDALLDSPAPPPMHESR
jgi:murein DD-endopeptidase MepM/ murein hydrolase activator NlpD